MPTAPRIGTLLACVLSLPGSFGCHRAQKTAKPGPLPPCAKRLADYRPPIASYQRSALPPTILDRKIRGQPLRFLRARFRWRSKHLVAELLRLKRRLPPGLDMIAYERLPDGRFQFIISCLVSPLPPPRAAPPGAKAPRLKKPRAAP